MRRLGLGLALGLVVWFGAEGAWGQDCIEPPSVEYHRSCNYYAQYESALAASRRENDPIPLSDDWQEYAEFHRSLVSLADGECSTSFWGTAQPGISRELCYAGATRLRYERRSRGGTACSSAESCLQAYFRVFGGKSQPLDLSSVCRDFQSPARGRGSAHCEYVVSAMLAVCPQAEGVEECRSCVLGQDQQRLYAIVRNVDRSGIGRRGFPPPAECTSLDAIQGAASTLSGFARPALEFLQQPENCFLCTMLVVVVYSSDVIAGIAFDVLVPPMALLASTLFTLWLFLKIAPAVFRGDDIYQALLPALPRYAITCLLLLTMWASIPGGSGGRAPDQTSALTAVYQGFLVPAVNLSALAAYETVKRSGAVSDDLEGDESRAGRMYQAARADAESLGRTPPPGSSASDLAEVLVRLVSSMMDVAGLGVARGIGFFDFVQASSGIGPSLVAIAVGLFLCVTYGLMLLVTASRLLDPVIRLILCVAAAPVGVVCYPFPASRPVTVSLLRMIFGCMIYLIVVGVVFSVAYFLVVVGIALGTDSRELMEQLGAGGGQLSSVPYDVIKQAVENSGARDSGGKLDLSYPVMNLVMSFLATGVIAQAPVVAGQISGSSFQMGIGDQVSQQAQAAVSHAGAFGMRAAGSMASMGMSGARALLGR